MNAFFQRSFKYLTVLLSLVVLIMSQAALAQGNSSGKGNGKNKNVGVGNASDGISASIVTDKDIFYTGDPLSISIRFNRGAELVSGGEVDAYLIVFAPSVDDSTAEDSEDIDTETDDSTAVDTEASLDALSDAIILPVSDKASSDEQKLFELEAVDVSTLPA